MGNLEGKIALVTGSGRGIGRAVALKFAREGAKVVINDLDPEVGDAVAAEIRDMGGEAVACNGSVTEADFGERFITTALESFGVPDIIVNNAGYTWDSMIQKMTDEQFDAMMDVHLKAPFRILRAVQPHWKAAAKAEAENGQPVNRKVVNISSVAGTGGNPGQVNYSSAKSGIVGMTKTLAKEWGRLNVNVNCVAFGYIETRLTEATDEKKEIEVQGNRIGVGIPKATANIFKSMIPMGRAGTADEAAGAVYLLTTPESDYISGQMIICGGGLSF
ncbi:SDR family NAD(P)-dependent oxidoreductase [Emcibacter sp.]|uniref:SDR family NAD(P)-dependent oxidoreductase n=1 Tax=Emcibacter sp. TaxID=1979954 RepID=UPI003A94DA58